MSIKNSSIILLKSLIIPFVGVMFVDYFSHLFFSNPMETPAYFMGKMALYFVFSLLFLSVLNLEKKEFAKVLIGGIIVALLWGAYYNVLPALTGYYPYGIALAGLSFWGMGLFGTGLAFGIVHAVAFMAGYYASKAIVKEIQ